MKLFSQKEIENLIVIDVETVSGYPAATDLPERLSELWDKRCDYLRRKHADNQDLSNDEIYNLKAGLQAEFGKIICITIGYIRFNTEGAAIIKTKSYSGDDEAELLRQFFTFAEQVPTKIPDAKFAGHNIKRFDLPYIFKRGLINGLEIPSNLILHGKKPWEINVEDTSDLWSNGAWQESFTSLDILTAVLGIPSPKSDIDGSEVTSVYWNDKDLNRIVEYCERDVTATSQVILKLSGLELANNENIIKV
jgi:predicted PolB exonuclease-like 3'-5' exonuclease